MQYFYKDLIWKWCNNLNLTECLHSWMVHAVESTVSVFVYWICCWAVKPMTHRHLAHTIFFLLLKAFLQNMVRVASCPRRWWIHCKNLTLISLLTVIAIMRPSFSQRSVDKHDFIITFSLITDWCICWLSSYKNEFWGKIPVSQVEIQTGMFSELRDVQIHDWGPEPLLVLVHQVCRTHVLIQLLRRGMG